MSVRKKLPADAPVFRPNKRVGARQGAITRPTCEITRIVLDEYRASHNGQLLPLEPHQIRILNHFFTPKNGRLPYRTLVYSCPKKSGKTEIGAAVSYAWAKTYGGDIYMIANDLDQAKDRAFNRVRDSMRHLNGQEPGRYAQEVHPDHHDLLIKNNQIKFQNDCLIKAIPCDPYGEAGGMQTLTVWDELWGYRHENASRLWTEMQPLPPGVGLVEESIRFVVTYAGWFGESELLWNLYDQVCKPDEQLVEQGIKPKGMEDLPVYAVDDICVYWDHEARMKWHTDPFLATAQREEPRANEYLRIWENRWTTGLEPFIDMDAYDRQIKQGTELGLFNHLNDVFPDVEVAA